MPADAILAFASYLNMTQPSAVRPPLRSGLRWLRNSVGVLLVLLAVLWLALPRWVQGRGAQMAGQALGRDVSFARVEFQPWRLGLVIEGVRVAGAAGAAGKGAALLTVERVDAALSLRSIRHGALILESLTVQKPVLRLARLADGRYDVDDLLARLARPASKPEAPPPAFAVYNIRLNEGQALFDDRPAARQHELAGLRMSLPFVSSLNADIKVRVQPQLSGRLNGVAFGSSAEALPFADRREASLNFKFDGLDLVPYIGYLPDGLPLRLQRGLVDAQLALHFSQAPKRAAVVSLGGSVALRDFALQTPAGAPWVGWQALRIALKDVQPLRRELRLGAVDLVGLTGVLQRDAAGKVWLPTMANAPSDERNTAPWLFSLDSLALTEAALDWRDAGLRPHATLRIDAINARLGALEWPLKAAVPLSFDLRAQAATLSGAGVLSPAQWALNWQWVDLDLAAVAPYVQALAPIQLRGLLAGRGELVLLEPLAAGAGAQARAVLSDLSVKKLSLAALPRSKEEPLLSFAALHLDELKLDMAAHQASLGRLSVTQPALNLARNAAGAWNFQALLPPAAAADGKPSPAWSLSLRALDIDAGRATLLEHGGAALAAEQIRLRLQNIAWPLSATAMPVELALKLGAPQAKSSTQGALSWQGQLGLAPLAASGKLDLERLPIHLLDAYLDPSWGLHLQRALLGLKGEFSLKQQEQGLQARLAGDLLLSDLALQQARQIDGERVIGEDLLSWQTLNLDGLKLALTPGTGPQIDVAEARLNDFFARLIVNEQGRFILRELGPQEAANKARATATRPASEAIQLAIGKTSLSKGRVDFSDRFIRPGYNARLSELQGSLGPFSSLKPEMAPLTLRGRVAGTGLLEIDGLLNPSSTALAMDIRAAATDIELAPLSPYAAKYAGYAIERGKFSTRVQYKIEPGGSLQANNQIVLNQLTFGDKVDSPEATSLPVLFAVALLKDKEGVIDVSLPVSGSINDPDFSVSGLIIKLILNLLGKALTAPFSLFSGNQSADLSQAAFAAGSAIPGAPEQLDKVAQMLEQRPGLSLTITGFADPAAEKTALQDAQLELMIQRQGGDQATALKRLYEASKLPNKPRHLIGLAKELPPAQMRALLMASYPVSGDAVRDLALQRGVAVRDALMDKGVPNSRIFLAAPKLQAAGAPRADLSLKLH